MMAAKRECVIWWQPDGFYISEGGTWLPGWFATVTAARRGFDVADRALLELQERLNRTEQRPISDGDLPPGGSGPAVVIRHGASIGSHEYRWTDGPAPELPWRGETWEREGLLFNADLLTRKVRVDQVTGTQTQRHRLTDEECAALERGESIADRVTARVQESRSQR